MNLRKLLGKKGQTSVEYILMLSVVISMGVAFFKQFKAYLIDNPDSYVKTQLKIYEKLYDKQNGYKVYRLPR